MKSGPPRRHADSETSGSDRERDRERDRDRDRERERDREVAEERPPSRDQREPRDRRERHTPETHERDRLVLCNTRSFDSDVNCSCILDLVKFIHGNTCNVSHCT